MLKRVLPAVLLAGISVAGAQATANVGFKQVQLPAAADHRPLHLAIWYPTNDDGPAAIVGENRARFGVRALIDARSTEDVHPLVVLSHGYSGSWRNLSWLAVELVKRGYVVAAPDHPGTTVFDKSPVEAARLWERPRDLSRAIDVLTADPLVAGAIEPDGVAAIGHSLGGWTVASVGGARFSTHQFTKDCETNTSPRACALAAELGIVPGNEAMLDGDLRDQRVGAVVSEI